MAFLEIACFTKESAILANVSGADRVELCSGAMVGGTTPDLVTLQELKSEITIPCFVMIRPRGGDFVYTPAEYHQMEKDIKRLKSLADGFVFGILDEKHCVDVDRNIHLVNLAMPIPCTFHRAFDKTANMNDTLIDIARCGFATILTSGGQADAALGAEKLKDLVIQASELGIHIMPGGGVRSNMLANLLTVTGAKFCHSSAITTEFPVANAEEILALKAICRKAP